MACQGCLRRRAKMKAWLETKRERERAKRERREAARANRRDIPADELRRDADVAGSEEQGLGGISGDKDWDQGAMHVARILAAERAARIAASNPPVIGADGTDERVPSADHQPGLRGRFKFGDWFSRDADGEAGKDH